MKAGYKGDRPHGTPSPSVTTLAWFSWLWRKWCVWANGGIGLFCKQGTHLLSDNLLQRNTRHSAAVGQAWPQQALVRSYSEIYWLKHVRRQYWVSCRYLVTLWQTGLTPAWPSSQSDGHGMPRSPQGRAAVAHWWLSVWSFLTGLSWGNWWRAVDEIQWLALLILEKWEAFMISVQRFSQKMPPKFCNKK